MTDRRPLLRAIYDAAVAAAHPDVVLASHLRPVPKGRVICLAAGKGAAAMAAAAERHYLDALEMEPSRLTGIATTRHGHGVPTRRIRVIEAGHPVPDEAGLKGADDSLKLAAEATADDLLLVLLSGGGSANWIAPVEWHQLCAEAAGDPGVAALRRADRRDQYGAKTSVADQGRPSGARRPGCRDRDAGDLRRAARRSVRDRIGTDGAGSDHACGCPRAGCEIRSEARRSDQPRAERSGQ